MLANSDLTVAARATSTLDAIAKAAEASAFAAPPTIDRGILDSLRGTPKDHLSGLELALQAGTVPGSALLDQLTEIQDRLAGSDEAIGAYVRASDESAAAQAGAIAKMVELQAPLFTALPDLYKPMLESWQEAALISSLAAIQSPFEAIARHLAKESDLWDSLRESAALRFSVVALSSLKEAITREPFSEGAIAAIRDQLGDWSAEPWIDPDLEVSARLERYFELGLEPRLVDSEPDVFGKVLRFTGIREEETRGEARQYLLLPAPGDEHESVDDESMVDVYRRLRSVESRLRQFIDRIMIAEHGDGWFRTRSPGDVLAKSKERRRERLKAGKIPHDSPLLFIDLGDCLKIIQRGDNWPYFERHFRSKEGVQESFARLTPLRADTAHSRNFSNADLLFFYAEILRIDLAISRDPGEDDE